MHGPYRFPADAGLAEASVDGWMTLLANHTPGNHTPGNHTSCQAPEQYQWAMKYLGQCVLNDMQMVGMCLGLFSILCWLLAQAPQIFKNFKHGNAASLSFFFLADWLAGDITNLVGCILTKQVPTQLYTAAYFCVIDSTMVIQWLYYEKIKKGRKPHTLSMVGVLAVVCFLPLAANFLPGGDTSAAAESFAPHRGGGRTLLTIPSFESRMGIIGYAVGCVSGLMYFTSRFPQIIKNFKRRSTKGLSLIMFTMAILGNVTYALGVLLQITQPAGDFIIDHLPWLVGSIGTVTLDVIIFCQFLCYGNGSGADEELSDEKTPLLKDASEDTYPVNGPVPQSPTRPIPSGKRGRKTVSASPNMLPYDARSLQNNSMA